MSRGLLYVGNFLSSAGFTRGYGEDLADQLERRGWRVVRTSQRPGRVARLVDMMRAAFVHRAEYELAHVDVFSGPSFLWAESVCAELKVLGKPYILTLHGGNLPAFARRWPRRVRRLLAGAAMVTAPSSYLCDAMRAYRGDIVLQPNALDLSAYPFTRRPRVQPRLIWVRAMHEIYNPVLAVEVLERLASQGQDVTLTMLGPDKDGSLARVQARARALGVEARLEMLGGVARADVAEHLSRADVFLNTADIDNTPLSLLEAMAGGLCVVSTRVGGIPYLIEDGRDGLLVPPRDPAAMTAAVTRLLDTPELASSISGAARARAQAHDWTPVLETWDRLLEEVARA